MVGFNNLTAPDCPKRGEKLPRVEHGDEENRDEDHGGVEDEERRL